MTRCDLPIPIKPLEPLVTHEGAPWLSQFNWINWLGLVMFIVPVVVSYFLVHYWLLNHDLMLYYGSLYAQLGLLLIAWKQV